MEALSTTYASTRPANHAKSVAMALVKVGLALVAALLLGLVLEHVPDAGPAWSLPTAPASAAAFTA